jgi:hypothetical protein
MRPLPPRTVLDHLVHDALGADDQGMSLRSIPRSPSGAVRCVTALACAAALAPAGDAHAAQHSVGSNEQVAWVRRAAGNFVAAELAGNGAAACAILNAPLRATIHHRTCAARMNAWLSRLLRGRGERARLRAERRAVRSAVVVIAGYHASIALPQPLLAGPNHFLWTENCWMLQG